MTTISSATLMALMVTALTGKTAAGARVFDPRTWPTTPGEMPIVLVQAPKEVKTGMGRSGGPQFTCVATLRVIGRVYAKSKAGETGATAALAAAAALQRQIEVAVINDYDLKCQVQEFTKVEIVTGVRSEGELVFGETVLDFDLEFYQDASDFAPIEADDIDELAIYADLLSVFSVDGDFTDEPTATPFVADAQPEPRTAGPDGRAEGVVIVTDLQD